MIPALGKVVLYFPAVDEGMGDRCYPAIVTKVGAAADYELMVAVIDPSSARMMPRTRLIYQNTWFANGSDPKIPHWRGMSSDYVTAP